MNPDLLQQHFEQTTAPSEPARSRIADRLDKAFRASPDGARRRRGGNFPGRAVRIVTVAIPSAAILVGLAVTLNSHHGPSPRDSIVGMSATFGLADQGTPVPLSEFDANSQQLLEASDISGASHLGDAAGLSYFQFTTTKGRACYGRAPAISGAIKVSLLNCFASLSGLPDAVVDMSTLALDPADTSRQLHLTDIGGIAASQVSTIEFTMADGQTIDAPVVGDVYGLQGSHLPSAAVESVAALSANGEILWEESFR
jgi:hypothetical protein